MFAWLPSLLLLSLLVASGRAAAAKSFVVSTLWPLAPGSMAELPPTTCDSCVKPTMKVNWWVNTGLNCPNDADDLGTCDICVGKGNTPEATKACQTAATAEDCCNMCMQWNAGHLPGGHVPGNALKCHSWFFRKNDKWCGLKNCAGPGKCGAAGPLSQPGNI